MTFRRWFWMTFALIFAGCALVGGVSYAWDLFGVFRDTHGRALTVYENERTAKYLLNQHYVPQNFDGLVIGTSMSANWKTDRIREAHVYNESIDGGNIAEEKLLVDQALPEGHFKYALMVLIPFMTQSHQLNEGGMGQPSHWEAIGSINMLREEWNAVLVNTHRQRREFYADGSKDLHTPKGVTGGFPMGSLAIDAEALEDYKQLIAELRRNGASIIIVIPPLYGPTYRNIHDPLQTYIQQTGLLPLGDAVIDFNGPAFATFCDRAENFDDGIHLSAAAAVELSAMLDREVQRVKR